MKSATGFTKRTSRGSPSVSRLCRRDVSNGSFGGSHRGPRSLEAEANDAAKGTQPYIRWQLADGADSDEDIFYNAESAADSQYRQTYNSLQVVVGVRCWCAAYPATRHFGRSKLYSVHYEFNTVTKKAISCNLFEIQKTFQEMEREKENDTRRIAHETAMMFSSGAGESFHATAPSSWERAHDVSAATSAASSRFAESQRTQIASSAALHRQHMARQTADWAEWRSRQARLARYR